MSEPESDPAPIGASALFRAHGAFVVAFVQRMGVDRAELEDLVQDVFLIAHKKGGFAPGTAKPTSWLATIAMGEIRNRRRKASRRAGVVSPGEAEREAVAHSGDPFESLDREQRARLVQAALDRLPEDKRSLFILFELEGETCPALAELFEVPVGTIYSRLHAARKAFEQAVRELRQGDGQA